MKYIKGPLSSDFAEEDFLHIEFVFLYFLVFLIHYAYCLIHQSLAFKLTFYKFIVLGSLGRIHSSFGLKNENQPYINQYHLKDISQFYKLIEWNKIGQSKN